MILILLTMFTILISGIVNLIASETFAASFPLHDGPYYKDGHSLAEDGPLNDRHVGRFNFNNFNSIFFFDILPT